MRVLPARIAGACLPIAIVALQAGAAAAAPGSCRGPEATGLQCPGVVSDADLAAAAADDASGVGGTTSRSKPSIVPGSAGHDALSFSAPTGYLFTVAPEAADIMRAHGATVADEQLGVWFVPSNEVAGPLRKELVARGALVAIDRNEVRGTRAITPDPSEPNQYVTGAIQTAGLEPPAPGRQKLLVIDTGLDLSHEEFAANPLFQAANGQSLDPSIDGEWHGTATLSTAAAPRNGVGIAGAYPGLPAVAWDGGSVGVSGLEELSALSWARANGVSVINMSFGAEGFSYAEFLALMRAAGKGILLVASAGNSGDLKNEAEFPAAYPHVVSVAATDRDDAPTFWTQRRPTNDVAAPGADVAAAVPAAFNLARPTTSGGMGSACEATSRYCLVSGTSFSSPITAGAAAWIWAAADAAGVRLTWQQVHLLLRRTARDVSTPGRDLATGNGIPSVTNALAALTHPPADDAGEPNDDIPLVNGKIFGRADAYLLRKQKRAASMTATLDANEDFDDMYRIYVPRGQKVTVRVRPKTADIDLCIWPKRATTALLPTRTRPLACAQHGGRKTELITLRNRTSSRVLYVDIYANAGKQTKSGRPAATGGRYTVTVVRAR